MSSFSSSDPLSYTGIDLVLQPQFITAQRAPTANDILEPGTRWLDQSDSPATIYETIGNGTWNEGGNALATTTDPGIVLINTDGTLTGADNSTVPTSLAAKTYIDSVAIAGAPAWSESVSGIGQLSTSAEATTGTNDNTAMTPLKVAQVLAAPPAIGSGTPAAGSFTTLAATGAVDFDAGGSWESGGAAINVGADASADAINVGTGASARTITVGNVTGATALALNSGTGGIALVSTGTGDITLDSDDTLLLDADGVLEINSSAGVISIGNDTVAQDINIGTGAAARTITIGNGTGATAVDLVGGTGGCTVGNNAVAQNVTVGNKTGATALALECGTGNFTLEGVAASTMTIGQANQTGAISVGVSTAGNTVNVANAANSGAQSVNIANGASGANSTVNILSGNGTAGTQTLNVLGGNRAGALNLATGSAAHVVAIGSASAGAVTVDTAAGISLDAATASNFTVTGASADLTLASSGGSVNITASEAASDAIVISASDAAGGITIDAGSGGVNVTGADLDVQGGDLKISGAAQQLQVEGGAATDFIGQATLVSGTVTVANTNIAATDKVLVTREGVGASTALGVLDVSISAATSFTITALQPSTPGSTETGDVSVVNYFIVRQL